MDRCGRQGPPPRIPVRDHSNAPKSVSEYCVAGRVRPVAGAGDRALPESGLSRRHDRVSEDSLGVSTDALTIGMLRTARYFDPIRTANLFGWVARSTGPMMREHKIGRANLTAAFPEKSPAAIEAILAGVWDNLGRVGAEFAHLDHVRDHDPDRAQDSRIEIDQRSYELFTQLRDDGKPALIFASHLANWELPALSAAPDCPPRSDAWSGTRWSRPRRRSAQSPHRRPRRRQPAKSTRAWVCGTHVCRR